MVAVLGVVGKAVQLDTEAAGQVVQAGSIQAVSNC